MAIADPSSEILLSWNRKFERILINLDFAWFAHAPIILFVIGTGTFRLTEAPLMGRLFAIAGYAHTNKNAEMPAIESRTPE